jgi:transcriptional regulator with XRE-family HTH domain
MAAKRRSLEPVEPGEYLRGKREEQGISLRKLGERSGLTFSYISELERGLRPWSATSLETLEGLARGLGVPVDEMIRVARGQYVRPEDLPGKAGRYKPSIRLPVYGSVAGGIRDFEAHELPVGYVAFDPEELPKGDPERLFVLIVNGDSMYEEGLPRPVPHGSRVVVEYGAIPSDGDLVVAWIDHPRHGEWAVIKQYREREEDILLRSYKRGGPAFWASEGEIRIVAVVRRVTFDL